MGKHRSRLKILAKILMITNCKNGVKKTHIMYQAYLSYKLLTRYLDDLIKADLICFGDNNSYLLTQNGKEYLEKFNEYSNLQKDIKEKKSYIAHTKLKLEKMCPNSKRY